MSNMDDLISRKTLLADFEKEFFGMYSDDYEYMIKWFKELPTAGQIIRCDECKYWDIEWIPSIGEGHYCPMMDHVMVGDEWCCYGERKEKND